MTACSNQTTATQTDTTADKPPVQEVTPVEKEDGRVVEVSLGEDNQDQIKSILAKADSMDGVEDHQVHKCAGCQLNMDGNADYAIHIAGYELHHCSSDCRSNFLKDPENRILALSSRVE